MSAPKERREGKTFCSTQSHSPLSFQERPSTRGENPQEVKGEEKEEGGESTPVWELSASGTKRGGGGRIPRPHYEKEGGGGVLGPASDHLFSGGEAESSLARKGRGKVCEDAVQEAGKRSPHLRKESTKHEGGKKRGRKNTG